MIKTKAQAHAADLASTPKGAGHEGLVASAPKAPNIPSAILQPTATNAILRCQTPPPSSPPMRLAIETALRNATPPFKSP
jgi:hypothetical protein